MPKTFFITTAIDYTNSPPHIGHAYEKVLADVIARYHRLKGEKVFFLTGVDQHGQKVQQSAAKAGIAPAEFVKGVTQRFVALWEKLDVKYDAWAETTDTHHKEVVRRLLRRLHEDKQIYKDKQAGFYSVRQEQFLTDKERGPDGEFGPEWGQVEFREEENYYFKLSDHKKWLLDYLNQRGDAVIPDFRQTELRNAVEKLTGDLCISRPKSRLDWGIELPFDEDFVTYVWFDALTNYISFAGYFPGAWFSVVGFFLRLAPWGKKKRLPSFRTLRPAVHVIGKDILVPAHGIYWLIMLHAIGFPDEALPQLLVHGWWNISGAKMSKSLGNIVDPNALVDKYGTEALRYYLMTDITTGKDADFSEDRLIERYNSDLANSLGNLLNRTLNMSAKYRERRLTKPAAIMQRPPIVSELDFEKSIAVYNAPFEQTAVSKDINPDELGEWQRQLSPTYAINAALNAPFRDILICNQTIEITKPWVLEKDPKRVHELDSILYTLSDSLRIIAILIWPVLPRAAHGIFDQLNWKMELSGKEERFRLEDAKWGGLPDGHVVGKPVPLFPRIEIA
jgi:methionyl-tRNA synthetase